MKKNQFLSTGIKAIASWLLIESTRGEMESRFEELEFAREANRRRIGAILESVQQLQNSVQALQTLQGALETLVRQFRLNEPYGCHDRRNFLDSRVDAIK